MEVDKTTQFKRSVSGTISAGMRSVFNGDNSRYFIIEHKDDSALHRRGEQQKIIVDQAFIGRDDKCQIRIDDQFMTVSREHALIVREGDNWKLLHRSQTNDTFVNGQQVVGEKVLQNGDEIQLSANGPRLGFIIPQGDQASAKSIGMTQRLNLFRQQALKPYKTAVTLISILLALAIGGLIFWIVWSQKHPKVEEKTVIVEKEDVKFQVSDFEDYVYYVRLTDISISTPKGTQSFKVNHNNLVYEHHYLNDGNETYKPVVGTGFITSDGYFITARRVIEPWAYVSLTNWDENDPLQVAAVLTSPLYGGIVDATFVAESKSGDRRTFHFRDFSVDQNMYKQVKVTATNNSTLEAKQAMSINDYAYVKTDFRGSSIVADKDYSTKLPSGVQLHVLGFPQGLGVESNHVQPQYTYATTSNSGLMQSSIPVTGANYEEGNSGGPVFSEKDGKFVVVGVVSSNIGKSGGVIIPMSSIPY